LKEGIQAMIVALDVQYDEKHLHGTAAAVVFERWTNSIPLREYTAVVENVQPYIPGQFFRRELPCLLAVLGKIQEPMTVIVVDGYVRLDDSPGLGQHLFEHLAQAVPVIGVAKTRFHAAVAAEVIRGGSKSPLYVTAIGTDLQHAANDIQSMHGLHRMPTLLKRVDQLAKGR
jgi:deoxyribonuclease V